MPKRIQRKRTKGWRMPPNTVYVGHPTKWGNPYSGAGEWRVDSPDEAVALYRELTDESPNFCDEVMRELRGKDLCCWCPLDQPCHADVLLEIAQL